MILKKINAFFALLATLVLVVHDSINSIMMITGRVEESPHVPAGILATAFVIHVIISIIIVATKRSGIKPQYASLYKGTVIQRATGILLIPIVLFHCFVRAGQYGIGLIPILIAHFFIMLLAFIHIIISFPNALVTFGVVTTSKAYIRVRVVVSVICAVLFSVGVFASITEVIAL